MSIEHGLSLGELVGTVSDCVYDSSRIQTCWRIRTDKLSVRSVPGQQSHLNRPDRSCWLESRISMCWCLRYGAMPYSIPDSLPTLAPDVLRPTRLVEPG
jgi:hypothetical protein